MASQAGGGIRFWPEGLFDGDSDAHDRDFAALLNALSRSLADAVSADVEMNASARRSMADVKEEAQRAEDMLTEDARNQVRAFRVALQDAHAQRAAAGGGNAPAVYDSADPQEDAMAAVLIQYLVRTGYAEVDTEDRGDSHYVYRIRPDWARLRALAEAEGHPLPI